MFQYLFEDNWLFVGVVVSILTVVGVALYQSIHNNKKQILQTFPKATFTASDPDVVIVGGGLAGATLAAVLGADGRRVVVIERDMSPNTASFRGEGFTSGGVVAIRELGLDHVLQSITPTLLDGYVHNDESINVTVAVPNRISGYLFRHGVFVNALRKHAMGVESVTFIHAVGKELIKENDRVVGVTYREKGSDTIKTIRAPLTVICDGYYSTFRKQYSTLPKAEPSTSTMLGIELENVYCKEGKTWVQTFLGNPLATYFTYCLGGDDHRLMIQVKGDPPKDMKHFLVDKLAPGMPDHMRKPMLEALTKQEPKAVPITIYSEDVTSIPPGMLSIGDALNTRDPITASGMTACLRDIIYWRNALQGLDLSDDQELMKLRIQFKRERHSWVWTLNTLAHVFATFVLNTDVATCSMRHQFMRTLKQLEGESKEDLLNVSDILAGVNSDPATLKATLETTRNGTMRQAFKSRPWTGVFSAIYEAVAIYFKFNEICGPAFKAYSDAQ